MKDGENLGATPEVTAHAGLDAKSDAGFGMRVCHTYHVECFGPDGALKWSDDFHNLVTFVGLKTYLDYTLKTGNAAPAWFVGLITGPGAGNTYAQADTSASHAGWAESTAYSNGTRPAYTPGVITFASSPASVDNSASKAVFNINGTATVAGCFMIDSSTKGGSTGILLGEGNFTGGDRLIWTRCKAYIACDAEVIDE